ncbi:MAG: hypothetical protein ACP5DC_00705 [Halothiobacillaceae bacterium]
MKIERTTLEISIITFVTGSIVVGTIIGGHVIGTFVFLFWMIVAAIWLSLRKRRGEKKATVSDPASETRQGE